jgi:hypothetical protein
MVYLHEIAPGRAKGLVGSIGFVAAVAAAHGMLLQANSDVP